ncbi:MAG: hypothetical protein HYX75_20970 [Acidobacteria bacterium]|nr:hypothetical protein [Acidobacteriota bacterium]
MRLNDDLIRDEIALFADERLRNAAIAAVDEYLAQHEHFASRAQLQSTSSIIQSSGYGGIKELAERQKSKNTKKENKEFWSFVFELLTRAEGPHALRPIVTDQLEKLGVLKSLASLTDKVALSRAKHENRDAAERLLNEIIGIYFEHFATHYYFCVGRE